MTELTLEERKNIMKPISRVCSVCGGTITRRPNMGRVMVTPARIEWRCENQECAEYTHWNKCGEHMVLWRRR